MSNSYKPISPETRIAFFRAHIHRMIHDFVHEGEYTDHKGKLYKNSLGILDVWEQIDLIQDGKA
jgi:hypothetical protein